MGEGRERQRKYYVYCRGEGKATKIIYHKRRITFQIFFVKIIYSNLNKYMRYYIIFKSIINLQSRFSKDLHYKMFRFSSAMCSLVACSSSITFYQHSPRISLTTVCSIQVRSVKNPSLLLLSFSFTLRWPHSHF